MLGPEPSLAMDSSLSGGPGFLKRPPIGISRPPTGIKPLQKADFSTSSFGVKSEWSGVTTWNVKGEDLELVPFDYPLERTHREIMNVTASVVSGRISQVLASMSIETEFDCKKAKAKCKTEDYVGFHIRLYAGSESGEPVVVEVQRRCGSVSSFMSTCRAILAAAEGQSAPKTTGISKRGPPLPVSQLKCLEPQLKKFQSVVEAEDALDGIVQMLRSTQLDTNLLGIESLVSLTDPIKTSPGVALLVSRSIVLGDNKHDIREEIRLMTERDVFAADTSDQEVKGMASPADQLRHFALMTFANAMSMCAKDGCLDAAVKSQSWFAEHLMPSLLGELRRAPSNALNAYQAACCLSSLLSCSSHACRFFFESSSSEALRDAHLYGQARHSLLARETEQCLKMLDSLSS
jgi:hypothetical protein